MTIRHSIHLFLAGTFLLAATLGAAEPTPAQADIALAEKSIARSPENHQNYNRLGMALARRARETADPAFYQKALQALQESFRLSPDNFEARKVEVWCLLGQHEFARASEAAQVLSKRSPDDIFVYGLLADSYAELGKYEEAEEAAQWMLNLRTGNVPGLTRGAYLREMFGDTEGALDFMSKAYQRTQPQETEDLAWILTQMGHLYLGIAKVDLAEQVLTQALTRFPDYHYALSNMGKVRWAQQRWSEAADLFGKRYESAPNPENLYDFAVALEKAGRKQEAKDSFAKFEKVARAEMEMADNSNHELVSYYVEHAKQPEEALRVAEQEIKRRQDVFTLDAYAWALHGSGRNAEAREQIETALAVGIRDARMFYHAGAIAAALHDMASAQRLWKQSLEINPVSEVAVEVRQALASTPAVAKDTGALAHGRQ